MMLTSLMAELAGDDGQPGGALLRQVRPSTAALGVTAVWFTFFGDFKKMLPSEF
jgi:hypothetical protein